MAGGWMLENSGLVLGVDSSFGLLTRFHNPRHVSVALLVHGWLVHLGEAGGRQSQRHREASYRVQCSAKAL